MSSISTIANRLLRRSENNDLLRMRVAVIGGMFMLMLLLVYRASKKWEISEIQRDPIFLLLPLVAVVLLFLRWPSLGLLALVVGALAIPFDLRTGTATRLNIAVLLPALLFGLWVYSRVARPGKADQELPSSRTLLPLLIFVVVSIIAFLVGFLPWFRFAQMASITAQLGGLAVFLLSAAVFLLMGVHVRNVKWLEWMVWAFLAIGSIYIVGQLIPGIGALTGRVLQRGTFNNSVFWIWMAALSFSQALFNTELKSNARVALWLLLGGTFAIALGRESGWTSGWLPPFIAIVVILWVSRSRWAWVSLGLGVLMGLTRIRSIRRLLFAGDNEYSLMTRLEAWRIVGEITSMSPLFGLGPANYYWYTPFYSILGWNVNFNSHNNYIDLLAQVGVLGLLAVVWFFIEVGVVGWRLRDKVPAGFPLAFVYGALGGLVGMVAAMMLGDWVLPFIYNVGLGGFRASVLGWLFIGGLLALEQMVRRGVFSAPAAQEEA